MTADDYLRDVSFQLRDLPWIGSAISAIAWIQSYQPLAFQNGEEPPLGTVESPGGQGEYVVFREGHPFRLGLDIANTGRFTLRILGVPQRPGRHFSARLLMSGPGQYSGFPRPFMRFIRST